MILLFLGLNSQAGRYKNIQYLDWKKSHKYAFLYLLSHLLTSPFGALGVVLGC